MWLQAGIHQLLSRENSAVKSFPFVKQSFQAASAGPVISKLATNPFANLPLAHSSPPVPVLHAWVDTSATAKRQDALRDITRTTALDESNVHNSETLTTPNQQDQVNKTRQTVSRQVITSRKRKTPVAPDLADNGAGALSTELQSAGMSTPAATTTNNHAMPSTTTAARPSLPGRTSVLQATVPTPTGPPPRKCQGCIHCDLLELKAMEPARIKHCLRKHEFLELATCAGECAQSIQAVFAAQPKANIHYCDSGKKGFDAPYDDPTKELMACGLVLCLVCHGTWSAQHALANSKNGATNGRTRRIRKPRA